VTVARATAVRGESWPKTPRSSRTPLELYRPEEQTSVRTLIDGASFFGAWFDGLDELEAALSSGREAAVLAHAYRFSPRLGREGIDSAVTALDSLSSLTRRGADVRVTVSPHLARLPNRGAFGALRAAGIDVSWGDGSVRRASHEKYSLFASGNTLKLFVGSLDPWTPRWDGNAHTYADPRRYGHRLAPSHDVGLCVELECDEAVDLLRRGDIAEVWRRINNPAIEILHKREVADVSLARLLLAGLRSAEQFIYIEDQYFLPDVDADGVSILDVLADRVRSGVDLIVVLPGPSRRGAPRQAIEQRSQAAVARLRDVVGASGGRVRIVGRLSEDSTTGDSRKLYVHSKLVVVDGRELLVGSANFTNRSLRFDNEVTARVRQPALIANLCRQLWNEHFGVRATDSDSLLDLRDEVFAAVAGPGTGLVELGARTARQRQIGNWAFARFVDPVS
jgi:phosphatidylserine/phosphatidylglycerophosphate/cardiolipin synthase-like enzyme